MILYSGFYKKVHGCVCAGSPPRPLTSLDPIVQMEADVAQSIYATFNPSEQNRVFRLVGPFRYLFSELR